jgi:hypothetical protein
MADERDDADLWRAPSLVGRCGPGEIRVPTWPRRPLTLDEAIDALRALRDLPGPRPPHVCSVHALAASGRPAVPSMPRAMDGSRARLAPDPVIVMQALRPGRRA